MIVEIAAALWGLAGITRVRSPSSPLPEREGLGVGSAEALGGLHQYVSSRLIGVAEHIRVPEPDHRPALPTQIGAAYLVLVDRVGMLAAVQLDGESSAAAGEVDDERRLDQLTCESRAVTADAMPQRALGGRRIIAQVPGSVRMGSMRRRMRRA